MLFQGKIEASTRWLIARVYGSTIPDVLISPFTLDIDGHTVLKPPAAYSLTSGELYCAVASKLFQVRAQ